MFFLPFSYQAIAPPETDIVEIDIPEPLPDPWESITWMSIGIVGTFLIAAVIFISVRTLLRKQERTLTAEYVALKKLEEIAPLAEDLKPNEFSLRISESLKDFVQARFNDPLRYETTDEFLYRISESENVSITPQVRDQLGEFLEIAEEIKFGRPPDAEAQKIPLYQKAVSIVETQRQVMREAAATARK